MSPAVELVKPEPAKLVADPGIPKLLTVPAPKQTLQAQNGNNSKRSKTGGRWKSGEARSGSELQPVDVMGEEPLIWCADEAIQQCSCRGSGGVLSTKSIQPRMHVA